MNSCPVLTMAGSHFRGGKWGEIGPRGEEEGREAGTGKWCMGNPLHPSCPPRAMKLRLPGPAASLSGLVPSPVRLSPASTRPLRGTLLPFPQPSDFSERPLDPPPPISSSPWSSPPPATHSLPACSLPTILLSVCLSSCGSSPVCGGQTPWGPSSVLGGAGGTVSSVPLRVVLSCNGRSEQTVAGGWWRGRAAPQRG